MKKKLIKAVSDVVVGLCMMLLLLLNTLTVKAADVSNPRTENGVTTWDCIYFGCYYQDEYQPKNPPENPVDEYAYVDSDGTEYSCIHLNEDENRTVKYYKKQPIKWRVLSIDENNNALVIADKGLDCRRYDESGKSVRWTKSTLRSWLNGYANTINEAGKDYTSNNFLDIAFTNAEQNAIQSRELKTEKNPEENEIGVYFIFDKVFLLSIDEIATSSFGFNSDFNAYSEARTCSPTVYAVGKGVDRKKVDAWWLRSPGSSEKRASFITTAGSVRTDGYYGSKDWNFMIRPAMLIKLNSSYVTKAQSVSAYVGKKREHKHNYISHITKEATCTSMGIQYFECSCGDEYFKEIQKDNTNHTGEKEIRNYVVSSEGVNGYSGDIYCKACGTLISKGNILPVLKQVELKKQAITVKNRTLNYKKLKNKKLSVKLSAKTDGDGELSYKIKKYPKGMKKYISVTKNGTVTLKKNAKKGKYQIRIIAKKTEQYEQAIKNVTIKVK